LVDATSWSPNQRLKKRFTRAITPDEACSARGPGRRQRRRSSDGSQVDRNA
jgi:hypothetical protein